jgi:hypothetical protein
MGKNRLTLGIIHHLFKDLNRSTKKFAETRQATWLIFKFATSHLRRTRVKFCATTVWGSKFMHLKSTIFWPEFPVSLGECYIKTVDIQGDSIARGPKLLSIKNYIIEIMTWKFMYIYRQRWETACPPPPSRYIRLVQWPAFVCVPHIDNSLGPLETESPCK